MLRGDEWIGTPGDEPRRRIPTVPPPVPERPRHRQKRGGRGLLGAIVRTIIAVVLVGGAGVWLYLTNREDLPPPIETAHYVNPEAGYSFDYPRSWELNADETTATVLHPERQALVSFGLGPKGSLEAASARLVREIRRNQRDVEVGESTQQQVAGHHAIAVNGTATNRSDEPIRFLAVMVRAANRNYAIVIYAAQDADPEQVVGPAQAMLTSFRPPEG